MVTEWEELRPALELLLRLIGPLFVLFSYAYKNYDRPFKIGAGFAFVVMRGAQAAVDLNPIMHILLLAGGGCLFLCFLLQMLLEHEENIWRIPLAVAGFALDLYLMP